MVPAVSIMSSSITQTLPSTSPITFMTSASLCDCRRLSMIASGASFSFFANARARATPPTSGDTTTRSPLSSEEAGGRAAARAPSAPAARGALAGGAGRGGASRRRSTHRGMRLEAR